MKAVRFSACFYQLDCRLKTTTTKNLLPSSGLNTVSLLRIQNLETYLASLLNRILHLTSDISTGEKKKKNLCILGETKFSKELMQHFLECVESQTFQFEQIIFNIVIIAMHCFNHLLPNLGRLPKTQIPLVSENFSTLTYSFSSWPTSY